MYHKPFVGRHRPSYRETNRTTGRNRNADPELTRLAEELTLREMLIAGLLNREGDPGWNVSEKGWKYMTKLMGLAGIDIKDAEFIDAPGSQKSKGGE
jgi:hypothetical protein